MKELPDPQTYEREMIFWPWGKLIGEVKGDVVRNSPEGAGVLDLMCGPGYLLGEISKERPDLRLAGIDINPDFIDYGRANYGGIDFIMADVSDLQVELKRDVVLCTGGLHHLPYDEQEGFVKKVAGILKPEGFCIFGDPCLRGYTTEKERKIAAAELGYHSLIAVIRNGGGESMVKSALDVMHNDVLGDEFKTSASKLRRMYSKFFSNVEAHKAWPTGDLEYGDYYFVLSNPIGEHNT